VRAIKKIALAGLLACGAAPLMAGPASADVSAPVQLTRVQYLTSTPTIANAQSCLDRSVYLTDGWYEPSYLWLGHWNDSQYEYHLSSGTYSMKVCLEPQMGSYRIEEVIRTANGTNIDEYLPNLTLGSSSTYAWGAELRHVG